MLLSDLAPAVCLVVAHHYPQSFVRVKEEFARHRLRVTPWINGDPTGSRALEFHQVNDLPSPSDWPYGGPMFAHRRAFREFVARSRGAGHPHFLMIEDDATFAPEADATLGAAEVPDDWELLYLGAYHCWAPTEDAGRNVLRLAGSTGSHAVAVRSTVYDLILDELPTLPTDQALADLIHPRGKSYAIFPAALIQEARHSTMTGRPQGGPELFAIRGSNW